MKKVLLVFAMVLLVPFYSQALGVYHGPAAGSELPTDLYQSLSAKNPALVPTRYSNCYGQIKVAPTFCVDIASTDYEDGIVQNSGDQVEYREFETTITSYTDSVIRYLITYEYWKRDSISLPYVFQSNRNTTGLFYVTVEDGYQCPPEGADENLINYRVNAYHGEALFCYDPQDLLDRDTCPNSTSDNDYILPVPANTIPATICRVLDDGSSCKYQPSAGGDYYQTDFENDCYLNIGIPDYEEPEFPYDDENPLQCQDIGNGVTICADDPNNVCDSSGNCQTGCGTVNNQFLCFSQDTDGDGLADYFDPDIDGDGIANGSDLDADGDGVDDKDYSNTPANNNGSGTTISLTELENLTRGTQSILNAGLGTLNQTAAQIRDKLDPVTDGTDENTASAAAFAKSADTLGGKTLTDSDGSFFNGITSKITVSGCSNPNFKGHDIFNMCDIAPKVATFMEWVLWGSLLWFLWEEFHSVFRRQS